MNFILIVILPTYISLQMHGADGQRDKRQLQCDYDGSKNINRDEFIWCFWSQNILFKRTFYRTYSRYDRNRDGNLSQQELGQLFDELDTNKDRKLTDDERNKVKPPI